MLDHHLTVNVDHDYKVLIPKAKKLFESVPDVVEQTKLVRMTILSEKLGNEIYLKREDTQPVFSFKIRGAYNCMHNLKEQNKNLKGVATASAG